MKPLKPTFYEKGFEAEFDLCSFAEGGVEDGSFAEGAVEAVFVCVFLDESVDGMFGDALDSIDEVADAVGVDGITEAEFCFHFIAFGDCYLAHVVAEPDEAGALPVVPAGGGAGPGVQPVEGMWVLPVAGDHFAIQAHAAHDEAEFSVAVSALVEVHEIHIDLLPGDVPIELGVQVEQWFMEDAQSADPHFCRGEGMHPSDDADTMGCVIGFDAGMVDLFRCFDGRAVDDPDGDLRGVVEGPGDGLGMAGYLL